METLGANPFEFGPEHAQFRDQPGEACTHFGGNFERDEKAHVYTRLTADWLL